MNTIKIIILVLSLFYSSYGQQQDSSMVNEEPMYGANNALIAFVHPSSTGGVLVEIVQKQS